MQYHCMWYHYVSKLKFQLQDNLKNVFLIRKYIIQNQVTYLLEKIQTILIVFKIYFSPVNAIINVFLEKNLKTYELKEQNQANTTSTISPAFFFRIQNIWSHLTINMLPKISTLTNHQGIPSTASHKMYMSNIFEIRFLSISKFLKDTLAKTNCSIQQGYILITESLG